jgi:hypothetical protein
MTWKPKFIVIVIVIIAIVAAFYFGRSVEQKQKQEIIETKLQPLVDLTFPKPPSEIFALTGKVKSVFGATVELEVQDPDDYLPHTDGSPYKTQTRFANITSQTKITLVDLKKIDSQGNPLKTPIKLSDLKPGDVITVQSNQNIRNEKKFDVTAIELAKY